MTETIRIYIHIWHYLYPTQIQKKNIELNTGPVISAWTESLPATANGEGERPSQSASHHETEAKRSSAPPNQGIPIPSSPPPYKFGAEKRGERAISFLPRRHRFPNPTATQLQHPHPIPKFNAEALIPSPAHGYRAQPPPPIRAIWDLTRFSSLTARAARLLI